MIRGYVLDAPTRELLARYRTEAERARIREAIDRGSPLYEMTDAERRVAHANFRLTAEFAMAHSLGG